MIDSKGLGDLSIETLYFFRSFSFYNLNKGTEMTFRKACCMIAEQVKSLPTLYIKTSLNSLVTM